MRAPGLAYGTVVTSARDFAATTAALRAALASEGFSVLYEADLGAAIGPAAGDPRRRSHLLGAVRADLIAPGFAFEENLDLLVPLQLVVRDDGERVTVAAIAARELLRIANNGLVLELGDAIDAALGRVLASLAAGENAPVP
ncbi:MAG: hypothetical protein ACREM2_07615 [Vulcanimicrobiaceae bacterium]